MTKIKLCGLSRPEDIKAANNLNPDFVGFVFAAGSRRHVSPEKAAELRRQLSPDITAVGVFVDADPDFISGLVRDGTIDWVQLHGSEDDDTIERIRNASGAVIVQAFRIASRDDVVRASKSTADYVLLDAGSGCGETFDWSLITDMERPWFLAGGLTPQNAADAVSAVSPWAADVSSGIETDGLKDAAKMAEFVQAVRGSGT